MRTTVGYAGGTKRNPTYRDLGDHTESIRVEYDPAKVTYDRLLAVFWASHSPTSPPWSRQYASLVFVATDEEERLARVSKSRVEAEKGETVHTQIVRAGVFTPAEDYHQKYHLKNVRELAAEVRKVLPKEAEFTASTVVARLNGLAGGDATPEDVKAALDEARWPAESAARILAILASRTGRPVGCR